jgi:hypothetical protein
MGRLIPAGTGLPATAMCIFPWPSPPRLEGMMEHGSSAEVTQSLVDEVGEEALDGTAMGIAHD